MLIGQDMARVFTTLEVAGLLNCSQWLIRSWAKRGQLPTVSGFGQLRFPADFILELAAGTKKLLPRNEEFQRAHAAKNVRRAAALVKARQAKIQKALLR